jgi:hypothetical protein
MHKKFLLIIFALLFSSGLHAQAYKNAVGIRAGYSSGLNYRHLAYRGMLYEGQALFNSTGFQFTALAGFQYTPHDKKRVYYYAGAGPYYGNWDGETAVGAALALGSEFVFRQVPLTIGAEWKPLVNLYRNFNHVIPDFGVTVRLVIN